MSLFLGALTALAVALGYALAAYLFYPRQGSWGWWRPFLVGLSGTGLAGLAMALLVVAVWPPFSLASLLALALLGVPAVLVYLNSRREGGEGVQLMDSYDANLRSGTGA